MPINEPVTADNILRLSKQVLNRRDLSHSQNVSSFEDALDFAPKKHRADIEKLADKVSPGMAVVPTFYKPPNKNAGPGSKELRREYKRRVRPRANAYLAQNFERELRDQLGFDDTAIERMRSGLSPRDKNGRFYDFTWDHIIELGGSGALAAEKENDPLLATLPGWPPMGPTAPVNHLYNLFALSSSEHAHKNEIMGKMVGPRSGATVTLSYVRDDGGAGSPPFLPQLAGFQPELKPSQIIGQADHAHDFLLGVLEMTAERPAVKAAMRKAAETEKHKPAAGQGFMGPGLNDKTVLNVVKAGADGRADLARIRMHFEEAEQSWRDSIAAVIKEADNYQAKRLLTRMKRAIGDLQALSPLSFDDGPPLHQRLQDLYHEAEQVLPQPMTKNAYQQRRDAPAGRPPAAGPPSPT